MHNICKQFSTYHVYVYFELSHYFTMEQKSLIQEPKILHYFYQIRNAPCFDCRKIRELYNFKSTYDCKMRTFLLQNAAKIKKYETVLKNKLFHTNV
jgi:hypothetical protein